MTTLNQILLVGFGGFLGSIVRFGVSQAIRSWFTHPFPFSTLAINVIGSFLIGLLFACLKDHRLFPALLLFLGIGFLGGFTTFSAFSLELLDLVKRDEAALAAFYALASVGLSLAAVWAGAAVGSHLTPLVSN